MKFIVQSKEFKRDIKRLANGKYRNIINTELRRVVSTLASGEQLDYLYRDHALIGNFRGLRECHLAFDLVLLYQLEEDRLKLVRLGSHSETLGL